MEEVYHPIPQQLLSGWTGLDIATPYLLAHKFDQMTTVCEN